MNVNKPSNDAKKVALDIYFKMFQNLQSIKMRALEVPIEYLDQEIFGSLDNPNDGLVDKLYNKLLDIINVKPDRTPENPPQAGEGMEEIKQQFADDPDLQTEIYDLDGDVELKEL